MSADDIIFKELGFLCEQCHKFTRCLQNNGFDKFLCERCMRRLKYNERR